MIRPTRRAYALDLGSRSDGSPTAEAIIAVAVTDLRDPELEPYLLELWQSWAHALEVYLADPREEVGLGILTGEILPVQ